MIKVITLYFLLLHKFKMRKEKKNLRIGLGIKEVIYGV